MLLTHTKLILGNNVTYMSAYNYFSAVPMVLLMELKIINDADKYLDKYIELESKVDTEGIARSGKEVVGNKVVAVKPAVGGWELKNLIWCSILNRVNIIIIKDKKWAV